MFLPFFDCAAGNTSGKVMLIINEYVSVCVCVFLFLGKFATRGASVACPRAGAEGLGLWTMLRTLRSRWGCDLPITTSLGPSADVAASLVP